MPLSRLCGTACRSSKLLSFCWNEYGVRANRHTACTPSIALVSTLFNISTMCLRRAPSLGSQTPVFHCHEGAHRPTSELPGQ
jgi:hypothetical protein